MKHIETNRKTLKLKYVETDRNKQTPNNTQRTDRKVKHIKTIKNALKYIEKEKHKNRKATMKFCSISPSYLF